MVAEEEEVINIGISNKIRLRSYPQQTGSRVQIVYPSQTPVYGRPVRVSAKNGFRIFGKK